MFVLWLIVLNKRLLLGSYPSNYELNASIEYLRKSTPNYCVTHNIL